MDGGSGIRDVAVASGAGYHPAGGDGRTVWDLAVCPLAGYEEGELQRQEEVIAEVGGSNRCRGTCIRQRRGSPGIGSRDRKGELTLEPREGVIRVIPTKPR